MIPIQVAESIRHKFSVHPPIFFAGDTETVKFELKPYLQPFEKLLALRELQALLDPEESVTEEHGYFLARTGKPEEFFQQRLTYWQRVGRQLLTPTLQKSLEFTQNGLAKTKEGQELHNSRRLRYGPHDLHEYRGKFFPQLVRSLMNISNVPENGIVLDPMCGSGTSPCEAIAFGRSAIGADLNPLSVLIATVKSAIVLESPTAFYDTTSRHLNRFTYKEVCANQIWSDDDVAYLHRWFAPQAIGDLAAIVHEINTVPSGLYRDFFRVCLSNIIRSVSWQKDTDLRVRKEIKPYHSGTAISCFQQETNEQIDRIYPYLCVVPHTVSAPTLSIRGGNAVRVEEIFPEYRGRVDLLVTSPPYATALPYLDTDRLSLIVVGLLPRKRHKEKEALMVGTREITERERRAEWERYRFRMNDLPASVNALINEIATSNHSDEIGFRRRNLPALLGMYFTDMLDAMRSARKLMRAGANAFYVVGNNSTMINGQKLEIPTDRFLFEIGKSAGWRQDETIDMELLSSRDIFKENRGSKETILRFRA